MKKTIIRAASLALALAMPLAGSVALATASSASSSSAGGSQADLNNIPKSTAYTFPNIDRTTSGTVNPAYGSNTSTSAPTVTYTGKTPLVPTYALGSWWSNYYSRINVLYGNQSMNTVSKDTSSYIGPWSRNVIVADVR